MSWSVMWSRFKRKFKKIKKRVVRSCGVVVSSKYSISRLSRDVSWCPRSIQMESESSIFSNLQKKELTRTKVTVAHTTSKSLSHIKSSSDSVHQSTHRHTVTIRTYPFLPP